jgi:hypothetical protein
MVIIDMSSSSTKIIYSSYHSNGLLINQFTHTEARARKIEIHIFIYIYIYIYIRLFIFLWSLSTWHNLRSKSMREKDLQHMTSCEKGRRRWKTPLMKVYFCTCSSAGKMKSRLIIPNLKKEIKYFARIKRLYISPCRSNWCVCETK